LNWPGVRADKVDLKSVRKAAEQLKRAKDIQELETLEQDNSNASGHKFQFALLARHRRPAG